MSVQPERRSLVSTPRDVSTPMTSFFQMKAGVVLGGRFELVDVIGSGGTGDVFEAEDVQSGARVAVKVLRQRGGADTDEATFAHLCRREVSALTRLRHPHIVSVRGHGAEPAPWVAMELIEGPSLAEVLADGGALGVEEALSVGIQLADALAHAHEHGVVHRDVKPANVLVFEPDHLAVKLVDFGLAKSYDDTDRTAVGALVGTPHYMAPELCDGRKADERTDIYAFGMVLYHLLAGRTAFSTFRGLSVLMAHVHEEPPPVAEARGGAVPPDVVEVLDRCIAKAPEDRFASAADVARALRKALGELEPLSMESNPWYPAPAAMPPRPSRTRWWLAGGMAMMVALAWWLHPPATSTEALQADANALESLPPSDGSESTDAVPEAPPIAASSGGAGEPRTHAESTTEDSSMPSVTPTVSVVPSASGGDRVDADLQDQPRSTAAEEPPVDAPPPVPKKVVVSLPPQDVQVDDESRDRRRRVDLKTPFGR